jgi:Na+-translocating ferredoxin:NAD+ oxidoreductase RnfG subunit
MFNKLKTALVLVVIGGLSGLIIFGINELTEDTIQANIEEQEKAYYRDIFGIDDNFNMYLDITELDGELDQEVVIYEADASGNKIQGVIYGVAYKDISKNNYGDITVIVGVDLTGKIAKVVIGSNNNTPTFVNKIKTKYLDSFIDQDISDYNVDTFTGASYTYGSVTNAIGLASDYYLESRGGE